MDNELLNSISRMIPNGNRLELPSRDEDPLANYPAVKKCLLTAGGKYKKCGFEFPDDAQAVKGRLLGGEAINDKKKFQFFATPALLASDLVELADIRDCHRVLEPQAGQAAIADRMQHAEEVVTVELMPENCTVLRRKGYAVHEADFLKMTPKDLGQFDRIVANPPFTKNQDIDHIRHMESFLAPGGKLTSIAGTSWIRGSQKKQVEFREWLDEMDAEITDVPAGAFKDSGTQIATVIVEIERAAA